MSDAIDPGSEHPGSDHPGRENPGSENPASDGAAGSGDAQADPGDEAQLAALESDLEAVASALSTLDRITADGPSGEAAAAEIAAVVSEERFGAPEQEPVPGA